MNLPASMRTMPGRARTAAMATHVFGVARDGIERRFVMCNQAVGGRQEWAARLSGACVSRAEATENCRGPECAEARPESGLTVGVSGERAERSEVRWTPG